MSTYKTYVKDDVIASDSFQQHYVYVVVMASGHKYLSDPEPEDKLHVMLWTAKNFATAAYGTVDILVDNGVTIGLNARHIESIAVLKH